MISNVMGGRYVTTSGGTSYPYVSSSSNPMQGAVRIQSNSPQVWDGNGWITFGGSVSVNLTPEAESILDWAKKKIAEEAEDAELRKKYPTLDQAYKDVEVAKKQAAFIKELVKSHSSNDGEAEAMVQAGP
jgi:hypothetical protein